nr:MAG TPA: hypothetical protein [Caudoviricetes sp.]
MQENFNPSQVVHKMSHESYVRVVFVRHFTSRLPGVSSKCLASVSRPKSFVRHFFRLFTWYFLQSVSRL